MSAGEKTREFQFLREIASGGFGSVYLTKISHPDGFSRLTAVKLLHRRWSDNEEISRRMRDEARLLGWLRHRHIVDVVDLTSLDGRTAIIMEYLEAVDLKQVIRASRASGELVPMRACFQVMMAAASALDAAYNRPPYAGEKPLCVIHRDIKPSNIMVDDSGHVKVLDFGVARADFAERESHTRELQFGSIDYMPPERLMFEPESPGSDVYSLGATIYELLGQEKLGKAKGSPLKHEAFVAERMEGLRARVGLSGATGEAVMEFLAEMLNYDPVDRPGAAQVTSRSRLLERQIKGLGLSEWSESHVPMLLNEASLEEPTSMNPLTGRTFCEDSVSYAGPPAKTQEDELPVPENTVSEDDPRWELLRAAAAEEVDASLSDAAPVAGGAESEMDDLSADPPSADAFEEALRLPSPIEEEEEAEPEPEFTDTTTDQGLGFSLSASMTLGVRSSGGGDDLDDDEVATTMMPIPQDEEDLDATAMIQAPLEEEEDEFDEGATRILSVEQIDAVSEASSKTGAAGTSGAPVEPEPIAIEEDLGGETMMLTDDTKNLLGSEAVLGKAGPVEDSMPDAPPMMPNPSLGAETILSHSGGGHALGGSTGTQTVSTGKRFVVSFMIFLLALGAGLGLGSALFYDELYGENGAISGLFGSSSTVPVEQAIALPGPIGGATATPMEGDAETGAVSGEPLEELPVDPVVNEGAEPMLTIRSLADGTESLVVRCEERKQYKGETEVQFALGSHEACTITATTASGRLRVKAKALQAGLLSCFAGGEKTCE